MAPSKRHTILGRTIQSQASSRPMVESYATPGRQGGFTLIELIIVMAIVGILTSLALPNLVQVPKRANEAVLKNNLHTLRQVLDQYNGDKGFYPESLEALVEEEYLRDLPLDTITKQREWGIEFDTFDEEFEPAETDLPEGGTPGIIDVYSLSEALSLDGTPYAEW